MSRASDDASIGSMQTKRARYESIEPRARSWSVQTLRRISSLALVRIQHALQSSRSSRGGAFCRRSPSATRRPRPAARAWSGRIRAKPGGSRPSVAPLRPRPRKPPPQTPRSSARSASMASISPARIPASSSAHEPRIREHRLHVRDHVGVDIRLVVREPVLGRPRQKRVLVALRHLALHIVAESPPPTSAPTGCCRRRSGNVSARIAT